MACFSSSFLLFPFVFSFGSGRARSFLASSLCFVQRRPFIIPPLSSCCLIALACFRRFLGSRFLLTDTAPLMGRCACRKQLYFAAIFSSFSVGWARNMLLEGWRHLPANHCGIPRLHFDGDADWKRMEVDTVIGQGHTSGHEADPAVSSAVAGDEGPVTSTLSTINFVDLFIWLTRPYRLPGQFPWACRPNTAISRPK